MRAACIREHIRDEYREETEGGEELDEDCIYSQGTMGRRKQAEPEKERDKSGWEGEDDRTGTNETMAEREQSENAVGPCLLQVQLALCTLC